MILARLWKSKHSLTAKEMILLLRVARIYHKAASLVELILDFQARIGCLLHSPSHSQFSHFSYPPGVKLQRSISAPRAPSPGHTELPAAQGRERGRGGLRWLVLARLRGAGATAHHRTFHRRLHRKGGGHKRIPDSLIPLVEDSTWGNQAAQPGRKMQQPPINPFIVVFLHGPLGCVFTVVSRV